MAGFRDAKVAQCFNTRARRFPLQLTFGFAIRDGPRITNVVQLLDRMRHSQTIQRATRNALDRARDRQSFCFAQSQRSTQRNHIVRRYVEHSSASMRDYSTYDAGKIDRTEQLNRWIMARQHTGKWTREEIAEIVGASRRQHSARAE